MFNINIIAKVDIRHFILPTKVCMFTTR